MNATPFKKCSQEGGDGKDFAKTGGNDGSADSFGKQMNAHGFNYHGTEVMYSGVLGTEFVCEIYFGVVYYQRLRHMVSDKYQVHTNNLYQWECAKSIIFTIESCMHLRRGPPTQGLQE